MTRRTDWIALADCAPCAALPDEAHADLTAGESLPQGRAQLEALRPDAGARVGDGEIDRCPRCGTHYRIDYRYDSDSSGPGQEDADFARLPPDLAQEALSACAPAEQAAFAARVDRVLSELAGILATGPQRLLAYAAQSLALRHLRRHEWRAAAALAGDPRPEVRAGVARVLDELDPTAAGAREALEPLVALLGDAALEWQVMRGLERLAARGLDRGAVLPLVIAARGRYWSWTLAGGFCERLAARKDAPPVRGLSGMIPLVVAALREHEAQQSGALEGVVKTLRFIGRSPADARRIAAEIASQGAGAGPRGKRLAALLRRRGRAPPRRRRGGGV